MLLMGGSTWRAPRVEGDAMMMSLGGEIGKEHGGDIEKELMTPVFLLTSRREGQEGLKKKGTRTGGDRSRSSWMWRKGGSRGEGI